MTRRELSLILPALEPRAARWDIPKATIQSSLGCFTRPATLSISCPLSGRVEAQRPVLSLTVWPPTGEVVEIHETTLLPGQMPHPAHKHLHTEFMFIREGSVQYTANGKSQELGPGGIAYAASGEMHGMKNVSSAPANYFVIAIGREQGG